MAIPSTISQAIPKKTAIEQRKMISIGQLNPPSQLHYNAGNVKMLLKKSGNISIFSKKTD
jgi:hypothetical protein